MSQCLVPNKTLYDKIDKKMDKYLVKLKQIMEKNTNNKMNGGTPVIIPVIIGVIINFFSVNHESVKYGDNPNFFKGVYSQMASLKRGKRLHIPNDLDYNLDDDRRRIQLFELLTKKQIDGRQLQVYNSFSKPRRDQVDIQRCMYILTTAYVEHKYGKSKSKGYENNIKSVIYSVFSNHLYLLVLIGFFLRDNDAEEEDARRAINDVIEHAMSIESIYLREDDISGINPFHIPKSDEFSFDEIHSSNNDFLGDNPMKTAPMKTRSQTRKTNDNDLFHDEIPMKTRSQARKTIDNNNSNVIPALGWERKSHMRYTGKYAKGGRKITKKRRVSSSRKKR